MLIAVDCCLLFLVFCSLVVACCLLFVACCLLLVLRCSMFTSFFSIIFFVVVVCRWLLCVGGC